MEKSRTTKRVWDAEADRILIENVADIGPRQWDLISESVAGRSGK